MQTLHREIENTTVDLGETISFIMALLTTTHKQSVKENIRSIVIKFNV